ncbi:hypothetical protein BCR33DRAFT_711742 [Rhizoclosmatium globosum]|uniref:Uncharacterized protein n=1 Tax=Rhizoclosmatium globosum TaxID=329046 RepID=A0A1Y2CZK0_9FUNG|nr:hypothetical protein BCR33DRAFT_711742 [Rhizoclosmatium globosum]|eukprot:ORY52420.1 hypothetical protein BCR33DRAFT_711742 [Rhizoclosmatium globosum]
MRSPLAWNESIMKRLLMLSGLVVSMSLKRHRRHEPRLRAKSRSRRDSHIFDEYVK